jgi:hypothetical protein
MSRNRLAEKLSVIGGALLGLLFIPDQNPERRSRVGRHQRPERNHQEMDDDDGNGFHGGQGIGEAADMDHDDDVSMEAGSGRVHSR